MGADLGLGRNMLGDKRKAVGGDIISPRRRPTLYTVNTTEVIYSLS